MVHLDCCLIVNTSTTFIIWILTMWRLLWLGLCMYSFTTYIWFFSRSLKIWKALLGSSYPLLIIFPIVVHKCFVCLLTALKRYLLKVMFTLILKFNRFYRIFLWVGIEKPVDPTQSKQISSNFADFRYCMLCIGLEIILAFCLQRAEWIGKNLPHLCMPLHCWTCEISQIGV